MAVWKVVVEAAAVVIAVDHSPVVAAAGAVEADAVTEVVMIGSVAIPPPITAVDPKRLVGNKTVVAVEKTTMHRGHVDKLRRRARTMVAGVDVEAVVVEAAVVDVVANQNLMDPSHHLRSLPTDGGPGRTLRHLLSLRRRSRRS